MLGRLADALVDDLAALGEDAGQQAAGQAGEAVGVDHAQRVVDVAEGPQPAQVVEREVHERRGDDAHRDRPPAVDVARRRGDRHQAGDHPVDAGDEARLAPGEVVPRDPHQERHRGAEVGVHHRAPTPRLRRSTGLRR